MGGDTEICTARGKSELRQKSVDMSQVLYGQYRILWRERVQKRENRALWGDPQGRDWDDTVSVGGYGILAG